VTPLIDNSRTVRSILREMVHWTSGQLVYIGRSPKISIHVQGNLTV